MTIFNSYVSLQEGKYDDNSIRFFGVPYFWTYPGRNIQKDVEKMFFVTIWLFNIAMENPHNKWRFIAGKIIYFDQGHRTTMANC